MNGVFYYIHIIFISMSGSNTYFAYCEMTAFPWNFEVAKWTFAFNSVSKMMKISKDKFSLTDILA
jgi:hypothetical protein